MELIKVFMGILLVICLLLNVNFKKVHDYLEEQRILNETIEASSPLGLYVEDFKGRVKIIDVLDYTPASNAGLEPGDRILKVNGCKIKNVKDFFECMEEANPDEHVKLVVHRVDSCSTFPVDIAPFETTCK